MTNDKSKIKYTVITLLKITAACLLGAFSFYKLTVQANLIPGGFTGIGAVIELATGGKVFGLRILTAGIIGVVLNVPFFIMSYKEVNKRFFWFSLYGMIMWSVMLEIVGRAMPKGVMDITFGTPALAPLLYAITSGVASGIASGIIVRLGYSTGGSELVAGIVTKRRPYIKVSTVTNAVKVFVIVLYALCVRSDNLAERIVLSLMSGIIASYMIDILVDGFKAAKAYYVISRKPQELADAILKGLNRSSTLFSGEGAMLHTEQKMLMCIVYNHEVAKLRAIVHKVDNRAFMFSTMVKEAYGTGFAEHKAPMRLPWAHQKISATREADPIIRATMALPLKNPTEAEQLSISEIIPPKITLETLSSEAVTLENSSVDTAAPENTPAEPPKQ